MNEQNRKTDKQNNFKRFLKNLFDQLQREGIITYIPSTSQEKLAVLSGYFEKLENDEEYRNIIKNLYYDKYIVKLEDIPKRYWRKLSEQYLEEGRGIINFENPQSERDIETRNKHLKEIINAQQESMDAWVNYLFSADSLLPMWAKMWAFQGMLRIGNFDKAKNRYLARDKGTVNSFVQMDAELIGKSVEYLKIHLNKDHVEDEQLDRLVNTESFLQIYGYLLVNKKEIKVNCKEGIWIKYNSCDSDEAKKLFLSLQGYNTGWCTADSFVTAKSQIDDGDFYIYYSKDENNQYKIPRIAIRMYGVLIREIRGILKDQNLEGEMNEILNEKLKEFADAEQFIKKVKNMDILTDIYKKYKTTVLSKEELRFLYQIDNNISGFGYVEDPRIKEILKSRNKKEDLSLIFDCCPEEIGIEPERIENKKLVYYYGDLNLEDVTSLKGVVFPEIVKGNVNLRNLKRAEDVVFPKNVEKNVNLSKLESVQNVTLPNTVGENLYLNRLVNVKGLNFPVYVKGSVNLESLKNGYGLVLPVHVGGFLYLNSLTSAVGVTLPDYVGITVVLSSLTSIEGLVLPKTIKIGINLDSLTTAKGLILPQFIKDLHFKNLRQLDDVKLPLAQDGTVDLQSLVAVKKLILADTVCNLYLNSLESLINVKLPSIIRNNVDLRSLTDARGLEQIKTICFNAHFDNLSIDDLIYTDFKYIGGRIYLKEGEYTFEEFKRLLNIKMEQRKLLSQKEMLVYNFPLNINENANRGFSNN